MLIRPDQLAAHLARAPEKGLARVYTVWGDEPLLAQEACDAIRAAARAAGCDERSVYTVSGAHFDWSGVIGASQAMSLFSARRLIELRIPSGKPGKDGSQALQTYCAHLGDEVLTLVQLPRLDRQQQQSAWFSALDAAGVQVRIDPIERPALPAWIARRLAAHGQRVADGEEGERALAFFADRVEGNLLAAHQEVQKLALLHPPGVLSFEQIESSVLDVARYEVQQLAEAVLSGDVRRSLRLLDGLQAEGESAVYLHWTLSEDLRALQRVRAAMRRGVPVAVAMQQARVWGRKERLFERVAAQVDDEQVETLLVAARWCDGLAKGLRHPQWPTDAWQGLRRLVLMTLQATSRMPRGGRAARAMVLEAG